MKKIALVFIIAVFVPSLALAWLAVRSLRDQQLILERQQSLLYQGVADSLAKDADTFVTEQQRDFGQQVENLLAGSPAFTVAANGAAPLGYQWQYNAANLKAAFDDRLRHVWKFAEVGFVVRLDNGQLLSPTSPTNLACAAFVTDFGKFLGNRESAQVYVNSKNGNAFDNNNQAQQLGQSQMPGQVAANANFANNGAEGDSQGRAANNLRNVMPVQKGAGQNFNDSQFSKVAASEAEFRQLVDKDSEGTVARFVENRLNVLVWHRSSRDTNVVFGAQLSLAQLKEAMKPLVDGVDPALRADVAVALLDDLGRPAAVSPAGFHANWKRPFAATELSEALPHWEMAVYLRNPEKLAQSARTLKLTLGLLIGVLLVAIGVGGWLLVADLNRQLRLARQKTDFVSNVSHELKTPLTSIRMFSELLAEGRVTEPQKRQSYLNIITAETSRLTRLINNVLDFSRMERGEKKYNFQGCDLAGLVGETVETFRPHLEANGFAVRFEAPRGEIAVNGDRDALAQVVVNLLSNAEKYSGSGREVIVEVARLPEPLPHVEVRVMDRGTGVPAGSEEKVFEKFYRAHDSLGSGIQGSGLGLTLARQIARAHGGDVVYRPREGGGSCFILRLPLASKT